MTTKRKPYKTYPKEFKLEAIRLMRESDRPASEIVSQEFNGAIKKCFYCVDSIAYGRTTK